MNAQISITHEDKFPILRITTDQGFFKFDPGTIGEAEIITQFERMVEVIIAHAISDRGGEIEERQAVDMDAEWRAHKEQVARGEVA